MLGPGSPAEAVERRQSKTSGRVSDNMPDRWSLPQRFVMECRTLKREGKSHIKQETVSAMGRLI